MSVVDEVCIDCQSISLSFSLSSNEADNEPSLDLAITTQEASTKRPPEDTEEENSARKPKYQRTKYSAKPRCMRIDHEGFVRTDTSPTIAEQLLDGKPFTELAPPLVAKILEEATVHNKKELQHALINFMVEKHDTYRPYVTCTKRESKKIARLGNIKDGVFAEDGLRSHRYVYPMAMYVMANYPAMYRHVREHVGMYNDLVDFKAQFVDIPEVTCLLQYRDDWSIMMQLANMALVMDDAFSAKGNIHAFCYCLGMMAAPVGFFSPRFGMVSFGGDQADRVKKLVKFVRYICDIPDSHYAGRTLPPGAVPPQPRRKRVSCVPPLDVSEDLPAVHPAPLEEEDALPAVEADMDVEVAADEAAQAEPVAEPVAEPEVVAADDTASDTVRPDITSASCPVLRIGNQRYFLLKKGDHVLYM
jgi:hypothetical protein